MKATRLLYLIIMMTCFASGVKAQFSSSDRVYCYELMYRMEDGIKSMEGLPNPGIRFFYFKNGYMGWTDASKQSVIDEGPEYYEKFVKEQFAKNYSQITSSSPSVSWATIFEFDNSLSSSSTYTYRSKDYSASTTYSLYGISPTHKWVSSSWKTPCYSFSSDRSQVVYWWTDDKIKYYYKLVDASKLRPNIDDIW